MPAVPPLSAGAARRATRSRPLILQTAVCAMSSPAGQITASSSPGREGRCPALPGRTARPLPERPGPCPRPEWEQQHPPGERNLQRREKRPQRADAPHGGKPPQPQPPGEQKEAEADPRGHPAAQDHPPSDRLCPAALRHCGGRLPHGHHAVQDQLHPGADGGRHAGGRGGRLRQRADLAGAGRPHRREHLQL